MGSISKQTSAIIAALGNFASFGTDQALWDALRRPESCDFMFGNPHEQAPQAYVDALVRGAQPTGKDHYAYTMDLPQATTAIASGLRARFRLAFRDEDVHMTNVNFAGLAIANDPVFSVTAVRVDAGRFMGTIPLFLTDPIATVGLDTPLAALSPAAVGVPLNTKRHTTRLRNVRNTTPVGRNSPDRTRIRRPVHSAGVSWKVRTGE